MLKDERLDRPLGIERARRRLIAIHLRGHLEVARVGVFSSASLGMMTATVSGSTIATIATMITGASSIGLRRWSTSSLPIRA